MKRMILPFVLLVLALNLPAAASEIRGSVEVRLDAGELPVTNGAVTVYLVGIPSEDGYRVLDRYGGGTIRVEDVTSGYLAGYLSELAGGGKQLLLDVDGKGVFSGLEEGLYLVKQTERMDGFYPFRAFLVRIPTDGQWDLWETPAILPITMEPPQTGDAAYVTLAAGGVILSGLGLAFCRFWEKRGRISE